MVTGQNSQLWSTSNSLETNTPQWWPSTKSCRKTFSFPELWAVVVSGGHTKSFTENSDVTSQQLHWQSLPPQAICMSCFWFIWQNFAFFVCLCSIHSLAVSLEPSMFTEWITVLCVVSLGKCEDTLVVQEIMWVIVLQRLEQSSSTPCRIPRIGIKESQMKRQKKLRSYMKKFSKSPSTHCRNIHFQTVLSCFVMNNVQQPTMCKENGWWLSVQQRSRVFRTSPTVWWH